jgi:hypothetical protein
VTNQRLPRERIVNYSVPRGIAEMLCSRAEREWGLDASIGLDTNRTRVSYFTGGQKLLRRTGTRRPAGAFVVRWQHPQPYQATIERIGWDPYQGGSEEEARRVLDHLAGYPIARLGAGR